MSVSITTSSGPDRERTVVGRWHVASRPERSITGTLTVPNVGRATLKLQGTLVGENWPSQNETVIGLATDGLDVTLAHAGYRSQSAPWFSGIDYGEEQPPVSEETWDGWAVAVGAALPAGGETTIDELVFRSRRLRDWAAPVGPKFEPATGPRTVGGHLSLPEDVEMTVPWGTLTLRWQTVGPYSTRGTNIRYFPELYLRLSQATTLDETWSLVVTPLLHFFSLITGEGDALECLRYRTASAKERDVWATDSFGQHLDDGWFEWVSSSWVTEPRNDEDVQYYKHPVPARASLPDLACLLTRWIELEQRAEAPLLDYFSTLMWSSMTFEESFVHVVRALETLHSTINPGPRIPSAEFRAIKRKLRDALKYDPHRDLILGRLSHADQFSLRDRLVALLDGAGYRLQNYAGDLVVFARWVRDRRDGITHTSSLGTSDTVELHRAHVVLDLLMRSTLLREIGIPILDLDEHVFRVDAARSLLYPIES